MMVLCSGFKKLKKKIADQNSIPWANWVYCSNKNRRYQSKLTPYFQGWNLHIVRVLLWIEVFSWRKWRKPRKHNPWKLVSWSLFKLGISQTQVHRFNAILIVQLCRCGDCSTPASYFGRQRFICWTENRLLRLRFRDFFFSNSEQILGQ